MSVTPEKLIEAIYADGIAAGSRNLGFFEEKGYSKTEIKELFTNGKDLYATFEGTDYVIRLVDGHITALPRFLTKSYFAGNISHSRDTIRKKRK